MLYLMLDNIWKIGLIFIPTSGHTGPSGKATKLLSHLGEYITRIFSQNILLGRRSCFHAFVTGKLII